MRFLLRDWLLLPCVSWFRSLFLKGILVGGASERRFEQSLYRWDLVESFDGRLERFLLRWVVGV